MDEEPPHNSMAIYSQAKTRTMTTNGHIMISATPEQGNTELNQMYDTDESGHLYIQTVSMYEAPHLTVEMIEEAKSGWPEYQWDMRVYGLPVLGSGAVFPFLTSSIECDTITPLPHWPVCASVDWGSTTDPTVVMFNAYDPDNDIYYVYDEYVLDGEHGELNDRSPESVARVIKNSYTPNIPIIVP